MIGQPRPKIRTDERNAPLALLTGRRGRTPTASDWDKAPYIDERPYKVRGQVEINEDGTSVAMTYQGYRLVYRARGEGEGELAKGFHKYVDVFDLPAAGWGTETETPTPRDIALFLCAINRAVRRNAKIASFVKANPEVQLQ